jgi:hypothetical protein
LIWIDALRAVLREEWPAGLLLALRRGLEARDVPPVTNVGMRLT